jgi:hypothetical protein
MLLLDTLLYYARFLVTMHILRAIAIICRSFIRLIDQYSSYCFNCRHTVSPWVLLEGCSFSVHRSDCSIVYQARFQQSNCSLVRFQQSPLWQHWAITWLL